MPIRWRKSVKIAPGVRLNLSKSGVGISGNVGPLTASTGPSGKRLTASIPGTGVAFSEQIGSGKRSSGRGGFRGCFRLALYIFGGLIGLGLIGGILNSLGGTSTRDRVEAVPTFTNTPLPVIAPTDIPTSTPTPTETPVPTPQPVLLPTNTPEIAERSIVPIPVQTDCDPSYPDVCIPPLPAIVNCETIPYRRFTVLQPDPHGLDGNKDGIGCQSD